MYFDQPGKENTDQTLKLASERGQELGINEVVVASSGGETAYKAMKLFVAATHRLMHPSISDNTIFENLCCESLMSEL